jgi:5'-methylthioadenosine phosphorylase
MGRLAVIGGHSILGADLPGAANDAGRGRPAGDGERGARGDRAGSPDGGGFLAGAERRELRTRDGAVMVLETDQLVLLQRHGLERYRAAYAIDHRANLRALAELDCDRVLAIGSTGGLREELGVGTFLCPDDFIALQLGISFSEGHGGERVPGFNRGWRRRVLEAWRQRSAVPIRDGGVYWQSIGPRFETPAEIRLIAAHADVIGMTLASECILAGELGISYAAVCVIDNLANGVGEAPLTPEEFEAGKAANRGRLLEALEAVVADLAGVEP